MSASDSCTYESAFSSVFPESVICQFDCYEHKMTKPQAQETHAWLCVQDKWNLATQMST